MRSCARPRSHACCHEPAPIPRDATLNRGADEPGSDLVRVGADVPVPRSSAHPATSAVQVQANLLAARTDATRRAYSSNWAGFTDLCAERLDSGEPLRALPANPTTVALYLAGHAGQRTIATLVQRCSSISAVHQAAGHPSPTTSAPVLTTLAGIRRVHGSAPVGKDPLLAHQVRQLVDALPREATSC